MIKEPIDTWAETGRIALFCALSLLFTVTMSETVSAAQHKLVSPGVSSLVPGEGAVTASASNGTIPGLIGFSPSYPAVSGTIAPGLFNGDSSTAKTKPSGAPSHTTTQSKDTHRAKSQRTVAMEDKGIGEKFMDAIKKMNPANLFNKDKGAPPAQENNRPSVSESGTKRSGDASMELKRQSTRVVNAVIDTGIDELERKLESHKFLRNVEITYEPAINGNTKLLQADVMIALMDEGASNAFGQLGWQEYDSEQGFNVGLGYRHLVSEELLLGLNAFYDYLDKPSVARYSIGIEAKGSWFDLSGNWYQGIGEGTLSGGQKVASLDGYDIELAGRIPLAPWLEYSGRYYEWQAAHSSQKDASGVDVAVRFQPVPLIGVETHYDIPEEGDGTWRIEANWKYRFGVPFSEQINLQRVQAEKPAYRRFERVRREYRHRIGNSEGPPVVALSSCDSGGATMVGPGQTFITRCTLGMAVGRASSPGPVQQTVQIRVSSPSLQNRIVIPADGCRVTPGNCVVDDDLSFNAYCTA